MCLRCLAGAFCHHRMSFHQSLALCLDALFKSVAMAIFGVVVTKNEVAWIQEIRDASGHTDPSLTSRGRAAIRGVFGK